MNILAGQTQDLIYDPETYDYKPANSTPMPIEGSPVFTIKSLNYWEWQSVLAEPTAVEQVRKACELALVSIDGDSAQVKGFLANPSMKMINPLNQAIVDAAAGF